jgi:hypothetical protein
MMETLPADVDEMTDDELYAELERRRIAGPNPRHSPALRRKPDRPYSFVRRRRAFLFSP